MARLTRRAGHAVAVEAVVASAGGVSGGRAGNVGSGVEMALPAHGTLLAPRAWTCNITVGANSTGRATEAVSRVASVATASCRVCTRIVQALIFSSGVLIAGFAPFTVQPISVESDTAGTCHSVLGRARTAISSKGSVQMACNLTPGAIETVPKEARIAFTQCIRSRIAVGILRGV